MSTPSKPDPQAASNPAAPPTPAPPATSPPPAGDGPSQEERNLAMFAHAGGILTGFVIPLLIWLQKKEQPGFVPEQSLETLNFQLTLLIGDLLGLLVIGIAGQIGLLVLIPVWITRLGLGMMGVMAAMEGKPFKYVINLRLVK